MPGARAGLMLMGAMPEGPMTPAMPAGLIPAGTAGPRGAAWGRNWLLKGCPAPICGRDTAVTPVPATPTTRPCRRRALTAPYWLSSWLCFSCSAATVAVAVAVAVAAAAATAAAAAAWVKSAGGRPACEGSPIPPGPLGLPA